MKLILYFILFVSLFCSFFLGVTSVYAQNEKYKSRLTFKKNQSAYIPKLPILLAKRSFKVQSSLETNLDMKSNNYLSQFFKSTFTVNSYPKSESIFDKKTWESNETNEYLFISEKLLVSNLYPNPATDFVDVDYKISNLGLEVRLRLFNVLGQEVKDLVLDPDQKNVRWQLRELNSGMYIYQLIVDGKSLISKKIIIRKQ
jgi:hypothetical protein